MRMLIVSPLASDAAYLLKALREHAHSIETARDFRDGFHMASRDRFDAIYAVVPDAVWIARLERLLPAYAQLPGAPVIVVLLAAANAAERARMLRGGADACFVQPYSFVEIQERIKGLRRVTPQASAGNGGNMPLLFWLDATAHEGMEGGRRVPLTRREFLLLECLMREPNLPVARDRVIRYAWPDTETVDPSNVNLVVSRLRRKFARHAITAQIETVDRFGYRIVVA